jgi:N-acetylglucosaminyl-diphospho-decaprenol L-rhamnosyltransferase
MSVGKVFCVIPVHNRLSCLKDCLAYLDAQDYEPVHIVVVDDGSTDGTPEYLATLSKKNLTVLEGNGDLWWGGAMRLGMEHVTALAHPDDYLLMLNDDVKVGTGFVSALVRTSRRHHGAVVGSVQRDQRSGVVLGTGFSIDYRAMKIYTLGERSFDGEVDCLPGRGALYPIPVIRKIGLVNSALFSHYFGDIEYSARAKDKGCLLTVSQDANVFTDGTSSDQGVRQRGSLAQWAHPRSKSNLVRRILFFSLRGPLLWRLCVLPRFTVLALYKFLSQLAKGRAGDRDKTG